VWTGTSEASGHVSATLALGQTAGTVKVEATSPFLLGSPVAFTVYVKPMPVAAGIQKLEKYSGDNQKGAVSSPFVDPLRIVAIDAYDNPKPNIPVNFFITSGEGDKISLLDSPSVMSDSNGVASVRVFAGPNTGPAAVRVFGAGSTVEFNLETVINPNSPELDIPTDLYQEVWENSMLTFSLSAEDDDIHDNLIFQAFQVGYLDLPEGAVLDTVGQGGNTAVFEWIPDYDQQGMYSIVLRVIDGKGGFDADTMTVKVKNVNRRPEIVATIPSGDTTVVGGQEIKFWVSAQDKDGDPLTYTWKVDYQIVGGDYPVYYHTINKSFTGNQIVDVFVNDGISPTSFRWILDVLTSVEFSEFAARFDESHQCIKIRWFTSQEMDNVGFDLYRSPTYEGEYVKINEELIPSQGGGEYSFIDKTVEVGHTYYYKLVDIDIRGNQREHGPIMVEVPLPQKFVLTQNYPNPFNPVTTLRYHVPKRSKVTLTIYNMLGQRVVALVDEEKDPGYYVLEWDGRDEMGRDVSTGIYIYRLWSPQQTITRRMVKIK